jgi:hypothetical protein
MKRSSLTFFLIFFLKFIYAQDNFNSHPEKGILPFNAPCKTCIEKLEKRTANSREFFEQNADGSKTIYAQKSYGGMNMKDENGYWRTIDPRPFPEGNKIFAARMQPSPVVLDFENKFVSISNSGKEFRFNKNISLVQIHDDGAETLFAEPDWSQLTRSENFSETTFLITEFYPGIDLQIITWQGRIKTNFILKKRLPLTDGMLAMRQQIEMSAGIHADLSQSVPMNGSMRSGRLSLADDNGQELFFFNLSHAWDSQERMQNNIEMPFQLNGNQLDFYVPVSWLNDASTSYPVTIDPFVSSSLILPQAQIMGSGFTASATCDQDGCSYFLDSLMTPPNCEIYAIECYFSYLASLPCIRDDGGFDITMYTSVDTCMTRSFTCLGGAQGACFFWPAQLLNAVPPLAPCLPPPQCASYPLDFRLRLRRCNWIPVVYCDASCVSANSDWNMTIVGRTVELNAISPVQTICDSNCAQLSATLIGGVPPYTVMWTPGLLTGNIVTVCPDTTTHYIAEVTDFCGVTADTLSTDVVVVDCTGIEELADPVVSIFPNPGSGDVTIRFSRTGSTKNIQLVNLLGETVIEKRNLKADMLIMDVSALPRGIYFAKVSSGRMRGNHKIILY